MLISNILLNNDLKVFTFVTRQSKVSLLNQVTSFYYYNEAIIYMKTSLCYTTRTAQCDLRINLQTGLFGDDITTVSLNTSKGLYIGGTSAKDTKSLSKVINRYMKKNSENVQRIIVVDGKEQKRM